MLDKQVQYLLQGINNDRTFVDGSPHQTHLRIITSRVMLITREQQHGSFGAAFIGIGSQLGRFFGSMGNVRPIPLLFDTI